MAILQGLTPEQQAMWERLFPSAALEIAQLKHKLAATDYKALKYAEGFIAEEEYAPIRAARQAIRDQINALEAELNALCNTPDGE